MVSVLILFMLYTTVINVRLLTSVATVFLLFSRNIFKSVRSVAQRVLESSNNVLIYNLLQSSLCVLSALAHLARTRTSKLYMVTESECKQCIYTGCDNSSAVLLVRVFVR